MHRVCALSGRDLGNIMADLTTIAIPHADTGEAVESSVTMTGEIRGPES